MPLLPSRISRRALIAAAPALLLPRAGLAALLPTPPATEGPFYPDPLPAEQDNDLVKIEGAVREAGGEILDLTGTLSDASGQPLPGVRVEIWQCDANGVYLHPGSRGAGDRDPAFQGFGHAVADADGRFAFRTIVPVPYPGRTPHIHVKLLQGGRELLTTQLYIAGHPQNARDWLFRRLSPAEQAAVSLELKPAAERAAFETAVRLVVAA